MMANIYNIIYIYKRLQKMYINHYLVMVNSQAQISLSFIDTDI